MKEIDINDRRCTLRGCSYDYMDTNLWRVHEK